MKASIGLAFLTCTFAVPSSALAHDESGPRAIIAISQAAEWRLAGARRATPSGPGRLHEATGDLVSDPAQEVVRFESAGRPLFVVPYDRIAVVHYEDAKYPRRFLWRSSFYLTIHFVDDAGQDAVETIRLLSRDDAVAALDAIERHSGCVTDRSEATSSFLGIPIRATTGTRVVVTDRDGRTTGGVISRLSSRSFLLDDEATGASRVFEEAAVRRIRLAYSPRHDALVGLAMGAGTGIFATWVVSGLGGCYDENRSDDCHVLRDMAIAGSAVGGVGALLGMTIGALRYPLNGAFDVYRGDAPGASTPYSISVRPEIGNRRRGVFVVVQF
jgi:hypothetical protein